MNSTGTEVFIANPDTNSLFILRTATNELDVDGSGQPVQIPVGAEPFDVEILQVKDASEMVVDRAYVANRGDDTMSIVNVDPQVRATTGPARVLANDFQGLTDLRIETMAGSEATKFLFLVSPNRQRLLRYRLEGGDPPASGDSPSPQGDFVVGPLPRRVALQE